VATLLFLSGVGLIAGTAYAEDRILTVYFSRVGTSRSFAGVDAVSSASLPSGNTIVIANMIHEAVGGDMFQIVTVTPYPAAYRDTTDLALKEQQDKARPRLATHVKKMGDYDVIFLGYPDWWGTLPMPLFTFLTEYDFSGKTIIPFCTHEGSGLGSSERDIARLCPNAKLLDGLAVRGSSVDGAQKTVQNWLAGLGYGSAKKTKSPTP
jgi:flavodoxin